MRRPSVHPRRIWPLVVPSALVLALLGPQLIGLRSFSPTNSLYIWYPWKWFAPEDTGIKTPGPFSDNWDALLPWHMENARRLLQGDLPLWTTYSTGGGDLLPNLGSMTAAPSTLLWMLLPDWYAAGFIKILELFGAWGFLFLVVRRMGVRPGPAAVAGLAFATTGFQVVWFSWPHTLVNMFVAGTLWAWDRVRESPGDPGRIAVAAAFTAATILEGFPAVAFVGLVAVGVVILVRVLADWPGWTASLRAGGAIALSAVLGLGISMVSFLPFAHLLSVYQLQRASTAPFPARGMLSTMLSPNSWGPADQYFGTANYIEIQGYLAPVALVLLVAGAILALARRRHVVLLLVLIVLGTVLYLYSYGVDPVYSLLRGLPVMSTNAPTRAKATGAILLCCAIGLGLDALLRGGASRLVRAIAMGLTVVVSTVLAFGLGKVAEKAPANQAEFVHGEIARAIVMIAVAAVIAVVLLVPRVPGTWVRRGAIVAVLVLVFIDAVAWIRPYWPSSRPKDFYPVTAPHAYLQEHLEGQRMASPELTFWSGTGAAYGIATMQGHLFTRPTWSEAIRAGGGRMASPTFSTFSADSASSPVLDRFGVLYWGDPPAVRRCTGSPPKGPLTLTLAPGQEVVAAEGGRARGVSVRLAADVRADTEIVVSAGDQRGVARVREGAPAGRRVYIPVPEPTDPTAQPRTYRVESVTGGTLRVHAKGTTPLVPCTQEEADSLQLELVEGAMLYRRLAALPRLRWASGSMVVGDPAQRLALLASGSLPADVVVLGEGTDQTPAGQGRLLDVTDTPDVTRVTTDSPSPGWLVVADPKQDGWQATIDGSPAAIVAADHAGAAVQVPAGSHVVELQAVPEGQRAGILISLLSLAAVLALGILGVVRHRRISRPAPPPGPGHQPDPRPELPAGPPPE